ncbi:hypothetical protein HK405_014677 [Cladochytrium tenue]|nr:hypothetical protein HK405_014677 [Cladochytrium tenue]
MATTFNVPNPLTWADFFNNMYRIPNSVLSDLVFNFKTAPLTHREEFEADYAPREDEDPRILQARQELCRDKNLKLFPYYYLDDKYGMTFADRELILQRFESGEDQLAYDRLVAKVKMHSP